MEKKFNNVFELLAEGERTGRTVELHHKLSDKNHWWGPINMDYHMATMVTFFAHGDLRLEPKAKKTVEGWILISPIYHLTGSREFSVKAAQHAVFDSPEAAAKCDEHGKYTVAKITFEVEE